MTTIATLFEGLEDVLSQAILDLERGSSAGEVAANHLQPHIENISKNAKQPMDATYVAYLLQYGLSRTG